MTSWARAHVTSTSRAGANGDFSQVSGRRVRGLGFRPMAALWDSTPRAPEEPFAALDLPLVAGALWTAGTQEFPVRMEISYVAAGSSRRSRGRAGWSPP